MKKAFYIILLVLLVGGVVWGGRWFYKQRSLSVWDGESRANVVVFLPIGEEFSMAMMSYQKNLGVVWVPLGDDLVVKVSRGYGEYPIKSLWKLSEQENDRRIINETISLLLETPVEWWLYGDQNEMDCEEANWDCIKKTMSYGAGNINVLSNMHWWDRWRLKRQIDNLAQSQVVKVDATNQNRVLGKTAADDERLVSLETQSVAGLLGARLVDARVREESLAIKIINTQGVAGLGATVEGIIVGMGGRVVSVESNLSELERCFVLGQEQAVQSYTAMRIKAIWNCEIRHGVIDPKTDLELWLGRETKEWRDGK